MKEIAEKRRKSQENEDWKNNDRRKDWFKITYEKTAYVRIKDLQLFFQAGVGA